MYIYIYIYIYIYSVEKKLYWKIPYLKENNVYIYIYISILKYESSIYIVNTFRGILFKIDMIIITKSLNDIIIVYCKILYNIIQLYYVYFGLVS